MAEGKRINSETARSEAPAGSSPVESGAGGSTGTVNNTRQSGPSDPEGRTSGRGKRILKWAAIIIGLIFFAAILREAMDPFGDEPYIEISHGDHVHYVPSDRDPNVPMGRFPTTEPAPDERITPDGRIVKKNDTASDPESRPPNDQPPSSSDQR